MARCAKPDVARLGAAYELGLLEEAEREEFERHLLGCDACFEDLADMEPVASRLRERRLAPGAVVDPSAGERERSRPRFPRWRTLVLGGAVAAAIAGVLVLRGSGPWAGQGALRGLERAAVVAYGPVGEVALPLELDWKVVPGSVSYEVRLFTDAEVLVWKAGVKGPPAPLPEGVRAGLMPGRTYVWEVEALDAGGKRLKSERTRFTVRR